MNDPHVKSLHYRIIPDETVDYDNASPVFAETVDFKVSLDSKDAIFEMKRHFSDQEAAKKIVDEYLQAWYVLTGLEHDPDDIKLAFDRAEIIDRSPPKPPNKKVDLQACISSHVMTSGNVTLHISRGKFPTLPQKFTISTDVETMYLRYKAYRQNREPLTSMANMCLTILQASVGGRKEAAQKYGISREVLNKLGNICDKKGSENEARKAPTDGQFTPLSSDEKTWIVKVVKAMIRRVGEYAYDPDINFKQLTMADFPDISTEKFS